jgi:hypothetical protein
MSIVVAADGAWQSASIAASKEVTVRSGRAKDRRTGYASANFTSILPALSPLSTPISARGAL